ncbi:hypothetical protein HMPREF1988_02257 [Porphyromonas gingivalis F0185]|nr:hypothetical protein HMPREF1988_02257 [Porphyromonas gingivalis F0185]
MKLQCCNIDLGVKLIGNGPIFLHNYCFFLTSSSLIFFSTRHSLRLPLFSV